MTAARVGRKQSPAWDLFEYDSQIARSKCLVVEGDKICRVLLKGKNPTNLKVHLGSSHKLANCENLDQVASGHSFHADKPSSV